MQITVVNKGATGTGLCSIVLQPGEVRVLSLREPIRPDWLRELVRLEGKGEISVIWPWTSADETLEKIQEKETTTLEPPKIEKQVLTTYNFSFSSSEQISVNNESHCSIEKTKKKKKKDKKEKDKKKDKKKKKVKKCLVEEPKPPKNQ